MLAFLQKIGKSLMFPIATLPAAALLVRLGAEDFFNWPVMAAAGDVILGNLPLIFAIGIAMGFAFDSGGGAALAGAVAHIVLTGVLLSIDKDIKMNVFGGVIAGVIAGLLYNKFYNVKFPEWLSFFGGRRFVPIITAVVMMLVGWLFGYAWPPVQGWINDAGNWAIDHGSIGVGVYGFLNRLLIPVGLHHVINTVVWFDFGSFTTSDGTVVKGEINRFLKGDPTAGPFLSGFFPIMMFGLPAACLAMYMTAKKEKKALVGGMFVSIALTAFITGVTEPIEFSFMFLSPVLFFVHAVLTGLSLMAANWLGIHDGFGFSAGLIDYVLNFGIATKPLLLIPLGLVVGAIYFAIFYFMIIKFDLKTPGREDDDEDEDGSTPLTGSTDEVLDAKAYHIIEGLGGKENIKRIDYCTTRLRLDVKDSTIIDEKKLKKYGARGVMKISKTNAQVIIGTSVEFLAEAMKVRLDNGNPPLKSDVSAEDIKSEDDVLSGAFIPADFTMPVTGEIIPLTDVPDKAFSEGMMGPGFGIQIEDGVITSPIDGKVVMIFPSKHAIGLVSDSGLEVLIHIGLDTVKLDGQGFETVVETDQLVQRGDVLIKVDLDYVSANVPSLVTPIILTNSQGKEVTLLKTGHQEAGTANIIDVK
ncbi:N-acetylglucosamine-specific PTS transporter subunit IIBC [Kurthia sibirica]|uniref:PTS N-acetyl glucosamine transporter subunit IIABC n=1 Tax=Kurthia sibirica TaxID=202750 RepID=A0A2U3AIH7_9BACL|nr:N-acetylglucosamine-specific PTS transporter subunit IIBC [Kurthia sibirica]PWI24353.1 PTS N-acetyl glucosamine transporter subunit IIABC [Kurthia sibirica]GEK33362.1 PTS N-acetyl glucosamine transporter subunit IIABC [Kurthia sibirica]